MFVTYAGEGGIDTWYCGGANSGTAGATVARLGAPGEPVARANAAAARKLRRAFTGPSVKRFAGGVNDAGDSADLLTPVCRPRTRCPLRQRRRLEGDDVFVQYPEKL